MDKRGGSHLSVTPIKQAGSLASLVAKQLEDMLAEKKLAIGEKLPTESALCDMFSVSRTVVREAISQLKSLGLLETQRGVGTMVVRHQVDVPVPYAALDPDILADVKHALELRLSLEPAAAALAAEHRDSADLEKLRSHLNDFDQKVANGEAAYEEDFGFHLALAAATKNPLFYFIFQQLGSLIIPRKKVQQDSQAHAVSASYLEQVSMEHKAVLQAIENKEPQKAEALMRLHLTRAKRAYEQT